MLHEPIEADPDVEQAVTDFTHIGAEIRTRSAALLKLPEGTINRRREEAQVADLVSRIATRAERLSLSADALMVLINDRLNEKARRGRGAPARPTVRTLMDGLAVAIAAEQDAERSHQLSAKYLDETRTARIAAQEACAAYGSGFIQAEVA
jgi:hypothetical protein